MKAVILAGGLGSRMAPITRIVAKEMLPVVDRPVMDYLVEDLINAGATEILVVSHKEKICIQNYFNNTKVHFTYIYPDAPLGVADALLHAKNFVGNQPFILLYGDVLFSAKPSSVEQMLKVYDKTACSVVATRRVPDKTVHLYGCLAFREIGGDKFVTSIIEKPHPKDAPSNMVLAGQYILTADIFPLLEEISAGELFTDSLLRLANGNNLAIAEIEGKCFDIGNKAGYVLATLHYAMSHQQIKREIKSFMYRFNKKDKEKSEQNGK